MRDPIADAKQFLDGYSHGWVWKRTDGKRQKCGGTPLCSQCRAERLVVELLEKAEEQSNSSDHQ